MRNAVEATAVDGGARPPGRRVQQGCRHHGPVRRRGCARDGGDADRRRTRRHPQPGDGPARGARPDRTRSARRDGARPPRSSASSTTGWGSSTPGLPEGDPPPPLPEGCFALVPLERPTEALVRVIREFKPHVMTTYDENGGYPHPDHIRCHQVSVAAYEAAADYRLYPDAGEPWNVSQAVLQPRLPAAAHAVAAGRVRQARPGGSVRRSGSRTGTRRSTCSQAG